MQSDIYIRLSNITEKDIRHIIQKFIIFKIFYS